MATSQIELGEVAAILPGFAVKARVEHEPEGRFQLIQGRHLTPGEPYSFKPADTLRITGARNAAAYQVEPGDLLIASRGPHNYVVQIRAVPEPTIAPATFYILRADLRIDADYLAWVLQQPPVQAEFARARTARLHPCCNAGSSSTFASPSRRWPSNAASPAWPR
jgi:hypothetical protein